MSHHRQAPSTSRSHDAHNVKPQAPRRSPPPSSREPATKRSRQGDLTSNRGAPRGDASSHHATVAAVTVQEEQTPVSPQLDSLLEEYDLGIDEEQRRRTTLEQSRKRRQAILDKYSNSANNPASNAAESRNSTPQPRTPSGTTQSESAETTSDKAPAAAPSQEPFSLTRSDFKGATQEAAAHPESASAAELDPDADRAQELERLEQRRRAQMQPSTTVSHPDHEEYEEIEVTDDEDDADMDMFALSDDDESGKVQGRKKTKTVRVPKRGSAKAAVPNSTATVLPIAGAAAATAATNLSSNWDDSEGYLRTILGEMLDDRYQIFAVLGRGMFASVVRARDVQADGREVAIKIQRVQESMYKSGLKEASILRKLNESDPEDRKHVVRLERCFDYKGHLCMVFESLGMNLRDVVRRYGRDVGLNMQAVRAYAHQLFLSLSHLAKNSVIHADIKPDNVLVSDSKALLKLCDLGSASYLSEMEITPYLVSRFYRAPEIILGQAYDCSVDVWSTGCTLYELATGKILFPGRTNNHMLLLMQELRGRFTTKQIRKSRFGEQHFDDVNAFLSMEQDKNTGQNVVRRVTLQNPTSSLRSRLLPGDTAKQLKAGQVKTMNHFIDLLERCLELDPLKRIKPKEALEHPFLAHL